MRHNLFNDAKRTVVKKRLLRPVEVEAEYGLPSGELAKKRVAGGGDAPPFLRFGRAIYYDRDDLEHWIASGKRIRDPCMVGRCAPAARMLIGIRLVFASASIQT